MNIYEVKSRTSHLIAELTEVWEASVKATHLFLSAPEIDNIKSYIPTALAEIAHLIIAKNDNGHAIAFMGINGCKLEMLFLAPDYCKQGLGKRLLLYGIEHHQINEVTVNEQNPLAQGFYEHMGFRTYKRIEHDEQGAPYPLLYMRRQHLSCRTSPLF